MNDYLTVLGEFACSMNCKTVLAGDFICSIINIHAIRFPVRDQTKCSLKDAKLPTSNLGRLCSKAVASKQSRRRKSHIKTFSL